MTEPTSDSALESTQQALAAEDAALTGAAARIKEHADGWEEADHDWDSEKVKTIIRETVNVIVQIRVKKLMSQP